MTKYEGLIKSEVVEFFANCTTRFSDNAKEIVNGYEEEWWAVVDTDEEEDFLADIVQVLIDEGNIWENNYRFDYINKTENYTEYDGTVENAPDEQTAWDLFLGYSGEYGIADPAEYLCIKDGE